MADRATIFIDGNNWFHGLCDIAVEDRGRLDYKKISEKIVGPRIWQETRYYIGQINQKHNPALYGQQAFLPLSKAPTRGSPFIWVESSRMSPRILRPLSWALIWRRRRRASIPQSFPS